jgi:hypothetical protein
MKKYFLHNGTESSGPFNLEELKDKKITKNAPVWFEGMENWKTAGEIPELESVFVIIPPPISSFMAIPPKQELDVKNEVKEERKIFGLSIKTFFIILGSLALLVIIGVLNTIEENRSQELKLRNYKTEVENHKYELKQKELLDQKKQEEEEEKARAENIKKERKLTVTNRILEIKNRIAAYSDSTEVAKRKLGDASSFKILRSASEKKEQISILQKQISNYKTQKDELEKESEELKLELEKIN